MIMAMVMLCTITGLTAFADASDEHWAQVYEQYINDYQELKEEFKDLYEIAETEEIKEEIQICINEIDSSISKTKEIAAKPQNTEEILGERSSAFYFYMPLKYNSLPRIKKKIEESQATPTPEPAPDNSSDSTPTTEWQRPTITHADYPDLPKDHWAYDTVMALTETGAFTGYEDGTFRPDENITHEEFLSALVRLLGIPTTPVGDDYVQVSTDDTSDPQYWSNRWVSWAQPYLNAALTARAPLKFPEDRVYLDKIALQTTISDFYNDDSMIQTRPFYYVYLHDGHSKEITHRFDDTHTGGLGQTDDTELVAIQSPITRKEVTRLITRGMHYLREQNPNNELYRTSNQISYETSFAKLFYEECGIDAFGYYYADVFEAVEDGLMCGYPDMTFKPDNNITRAEAAATLARLIYGDLRLTVTIPEVTDDMLHMISYIIV